MYSPLKKKLIKACPRILIKPVVNVVREGRRIRYWTSMVLNPDKMRLLCPCCGLKFQFFVAGNYLKRPEKFNPARYEQTRQDVLCPFCRALPRHRILALWCERHKTSLQSSNILYFAPEISMILWMKRNRVKCTTADLYKDYTDMKLDIQSTGLPDGSYNVIICNHVLEHVDDFKIALKEVYRILRPGGLFICSFPMDPTLELVDEDYTVRTVEGRIKRFGQDDHKRVFGMKADRFLEEVGFSVETICGEDYPDEILPVIGPADYDINRLFCCRK